MNLENVIDNSIQIDGSFVVTVSATFYQSTDAFPTPSGADSILPLSKNISQPHKEAQVVNMLKLPSVSQTVERCCFYNF